MATEENPLGGIISKEPEIVGFPKEAGGRNIAEPQREETPMINYISGLVFTVLLLIGGGLVASIWNTNPALAFGIVWFLGDLIIASAIRLAAQWEKGVVFRLGKFSSIKGQGLFLIIPLRSS